MKVTCTLELTYDSKNQANQVFRSVQIDDASFMNTSVNKNILQTTIETSSVSSMLHTVDDFLSCVHIAEKIIEKKK